MRKPPSNLLLDEKPLVLIPALAVVVGLIEALFLQQLHYWLQKPNMGVQHDDRKWVYNTISAWHEQLPFVSTRTLQRAIDSLRQRRLLITETLAQVPRIAKQTGQDPRDRILYYTIDYDVLSDLCDGTAHTSDDGCPPSCQLGTLQDTSAERCKEANRRHVFSAETTAEITGRQQQARGTCQEQPAAVDAAAFRPIGNQRRYCGITVWTNGDVGLIKALIAADGEDAVTQQAAENLKQGIALGKDGMPLASGVAKALARKRADAARKAADAEQHRQATTPAEDSTTAALKAKALMAEYARLQS